MINFDLRISRDLDTSGYFLIFTPCARELHSQFHPKRLKLTCYDVNGHNLKFFADLAQIIKKEKHRMIICSKQAGWLNFLTVRHFLSFFS